MIGTVVFVWVVGALCAAAAFGLGYRLGQAAGVSAITAALFDEEAG